MTTTALDLPRATDRTRGWARFLPALGGLALVAGLVTLLVTPAGGDTGETPADVVAYASAHEGWVLAAALYGIVSILLGGAFVAGLRARLSGIATATEANLVLVGGIAFTVCFTLCISAWNAPLVDLPADPERARMQAEAYLAFDDFGWFLLCATGLSAALMAVPASVAALRAGVVPTWIAWLGIVAGAASVATVAFFGIFAWMAWIAGASVVLLVAAARD